MISCCPGHQESRRTQTRENPPVKTACRWDDSTGSSLSTEVSAATPAVKMIGKTILKEKHRINACHLHEILHLLCVIHNTHTKCTVTPVTTLNCAVCSNYRVRWHLKQFTPTKLLKINVQEISYISDLLWQNVILATPKTDHIFSTPNRLKLILYML